MWVKNKENILLNVEHIFKRNFIWTRIMAAEILSGVYNSHIRWPIYTLSCKVNQKYENLYIRYTSVVEVLTWFYPSLRHY